ncbi:glycosyltransferase [Enterococcus alishanensis]|uniref:Glycosyltransferase family 2 protein n=1 Tax=Enterococcus alishanensis TaxID=1303817 RepID=A0ABS6TCN1_9ENTE|nr:glycosyltransferase family 2 protein [Enterococcus alishanensis]MBV7390641.1 glycosyltransferase family 2 protein [Enterococcus alishanensis]
MENFVNLIVLNYNNYQETSNFVKIMEERRQIDQIIVVDNASTDRSYEYLWRLRNKKVHVIQATKNGGYSAGNNFGIFYGLKHFKPQFFLIANPDIAISEEDLDQFIKNLADLPKKTGIVAPIMLTKEKSQAYNSGWQLPSYGSDLLATSLILNKFFKKRNSYGSLPDEKKLIPVDVLPGSFFAISAEALEEIGYLDETTFLYCEERILSYKLRAHSYRNFLDSRFVYFHDHGTTTKKQISKLKQQEIYFSSIRYYLNHYLQVSTWQKNVFSFFAYAGLLERKLIYSWQDWLLEKRQKNGEN